jgi:hypothetical protein
MGFLSSLGKIAMNAAESFETIVQHPIASIKTIGNQAAFNTLSQQTNSKPLTTQIGNILLSTGTAAAAVIGGGAALGSTTARSIGGTILSAAAKLIPSTTKGKVIATIAAPVVASAVISNPGGTIRAVKNTVSAQIDLGKTIANPSLSSAESFLKEHPGASVALGAGGLALVGGGLGLAANTLATFTNSAATRANTAAGSTPDQAVSAALPIDTSTRLSAPEVMQPSVSAPTAPTTAITPQTQTITSSSTSVRRKKHYKKLTIAPISQKVNVIVSNRATGTQTKTYLNRGIYA